MTKKTDYIIALIGGTGRSGTTLLSKILSSHPDTANVPELRFLVDPEGILDYYASSKVMWTPYVANQRLERLLNLLNDVSHAPHPFVRRVYRVIELLTGVQVAPRYQSINVSSYCRDFDRLVNELENDLVRIEYSIKWSGSEPWRSKGFRYVSPNIEMIRAALVRFLDKVYKSILEEQRKSVYLEKNTWNIFWYDHMLELFPNSKMVHMVRDPRAVAVSFQKQSWMPNDIESCTKIILDLHEEWSRRSTHIASDRYYNVRFEDLLSDPDSTLENIFSFYEMGSSNIYQIPKLDLNAESAWKKDLSRHTHDWMTDQFGSILERYGYE